MTEPTGSAKTHATARRKLRQKLEAAGYPAQIVAQRVETLRKAQGRDRPPAAGKQTSKRVLIYERDGYRCRYCGIQVETDSVSWERRATLDHVLPRACGGLGTFDNLVTACRPCNARKGNRTPAQAGMVLLPAAGVDGSAGNTVGSSAVLIREGAPHV